MRWLRAAAATGIGRAVRILNISQNYHVVGGMDVAMFTLERVLREHGHEVIPFAAADPRNGPTPWARYFPPAPPTEATGAAASLRTLYSPAARRALARLLDDEAIDLVHLHSYFKRLTPAILPAIARRGIPIVQTLHEYRATCPVSTAYRDGHLCTECAGGRYAQVLRHRCANGSLARSAWNYAEMRLSDALGHKRVIQRYIAVSRFQRDLLVAMGMPADRMTVVPNPVTVPPVSTAPRDGSVLFFGRLETVKGVDLLPAVAAQLPHRQVVVAGEGSRRAAVEAAAAAAGVTNLTFLGRLDGAALAAAIGRAACVLVPSLWPEAFGLTAAEALAQATPVVAAATGGLTDTVRDKIDGFLVPHGDAAAAAAAIRRLTDDRALARRFGEAGRQRMAAEFTPDLFYARTMAVYDEAIAAARDPAQGR